MVQTPTDTTIEELDAEWTLGSWSIGRVQPTGHFSASIHGHGACQIGSGRTPREAFDNAVMAFRRDYPDEMTAKRKRLQQAREDAERLERELSGQAA